MSDVHRTRNARQGLIDLLPAQAVPSGTFGGPTETREKLGDQIVTFVEEWLRSSLGGTQADPGAFADLWRQEMGRDDLLAATLDRIEADNEDREGLMRAVAQMVPTYAWQVKHRLIVRMHPESWNRYSNNITGALIGESEPILKKVVLRCNFRQPQDILTLSGTDVDGDVDCGVHLLR